MPTAQAGVRSPPIFRNPRCRSGAQASGGVANHEERGVRSPPIVATRLQAAIYGGSTRGKAECNKKKPNATKVEAAA